MSLSPPGGRMHPLIPGMGSSMPAARMSTSAISPDDLIERPFLVEPYRAWRCWEVVNHERRGLLLRSITYKIHWSPRRAFRAHCLARPPKVSTPEEAASHCSPDKLHRCGVYSLKRRDWVEAWAMSGQKALVYGLVLVWGRVIEHEFGYLTEYAYPLSFEGITALKGWDYAELDPHEILPMVADRYGIANEVLL